MKQIHKKRGISLSHVKAQQSPSKFIQKGGKPDFHTTNIYSSNIRQVLVHPKHLVELPSQRQSYIPKQIVRISYSSPKTKDQILTFPHPFINNSPQTIGFQTDRNLRYQYSEFEQNTKVRTHQNILTASKAAQPFQKIQINVQNDSKRQNVYPISINKQQFNLDKDNSQIKLQPDLLHQNKEIKNDNKSLKEYHKNEKFAQPERTYILNQEDRKINNSLVKDRMRKLNQIERKLINIINLCDEHSK